MLKSCFLLLYRTYGDPSKGADDLFLKHPNAISSAAPPDSATPKPAKGKNSTTHGSFDGRIS